MVSSEHTTSLNELVRDFNKELHHGLGLLHKSTYKKCLFEHDCNDPTILGHSVSRSMLKSIQHNGEVISPNARTSKDLSGLSNLNLKFMPEGVGRASTGTFTCQAHDSLFQSIDSSPFHFEDLSTLNLLYYRAILRETWLLSKVRPGVAHAERYGPVPTPFSIHPNTRLKALRDSIKSVYPHLLGPDCPVGHIVRRIKTPRPILAASCAGGSLISINNIELPVSWTFSVLPQADEHVVVASYLKGSVGQTYFSHFGEVDGRELQAAVSAELIYFGENWFIHPKAWCGYGEKKRDSIIEAYDNFKELIAGDYKWWDRDPKTPWHKYLGVANRHQLNLFRYDESVFAP